MHAQESVLYIGPYSLKVRPPQEGNQVCDGPLQPRSVIDHVRTAGVAPTASEAFLSSPIRPS